MNAVWDDGSDDESTEDKENEWGGYAATIFLIEATKPMFNPDLNDQSYFAKCIECCKAFLLEQIRSSRKGPTAIVLFGTKQGTDSWNNVSVLQDLSQPSADKVKELIKILESDDFEGFDKKFGHSNDFSIANALWFCHQLLSGYKLKLSTKHIIMMTCTPDPHVNDRDKQKQAKDRASSLNDASVLLNVVPLGSRFDKKAFYSGLVQIVNGQDEEDFVGIEEPSESAEEIIRHINSCGSQKRSTARVMWHLGNGVKLSVAVYNLVQPRFVPPKRRLHRETNDEVQSKPQMFSADTGEVQHTVKEMKVVEYAEKKISFTPDEWRQAKQIAENGITLLGFKPTTCVKHFVEKGAFIYPEDLLVNGSRTLFAALHDRCIARDVVPICLFKPRKVSPPKMVALLPQEEKKDAKGVQIAPPGFVIYYLPYANHIRDVSIYYSHNLLDPNPELEDVAKEIVARLTADYDPNAIRNPKIRTHWANIEAIALGLEAPESVPDETLPDNEKMGELLGDVTREFKEMAFGSDFEPSEVLALKRTQKASERPAKKLKLNLDINNMADIAQAGQVGEFKVEELKRFLKDKSVGFPSNAKKADLVRLVYDHFKIDQ